MNYINGKHTATDTKEGFMKWKDFLYHENHPCYRYSNSKAYQLFLDLQKNRGCEKHVFIMTWGPTKSGKTKFVDEVIPKYINYLDTEIISKEKIKEEIKKNSRRKNSTTNSTAVSFKVEKTIRQNLLLGKNVIYDDINLNMIERMDILNKIEDIDCEKLCITFTPSIDECLNRLHKESNSNDWLLEANLKIAEFPFFHEGWDYIIPDYIFTEPNNEEIFSDNINWSDIMKNVGDIDEELGLSGYRSIGGHVETMQSFLERDYPERVHLIDAALFHDISIQFSKEPNPNLSGYYYMSKNRESAIKRLMNDRSNILINKLLDRYLYDLYVANLIRWRFEVNSHYIHIDEWTDFDMAIWYFKLLNEEIKKDILILASAHQIALSWGSPVYINKPLYGHSFKEDLSNDNKNDIP